ncbi:MAG: hypothetical protein AB2A00_38305 [Myxococcota bacterium]
MHLESGFPLGTCPACGQRALAWYELGDDGEPGARSLCCSAVLDELSSGDEAELRALGLDVFEPPSPGGCGERGGCRSGGCTTRKRAVVDEKPGAKLRVVD